mmetsp:Transcript_18403/g.27375  ORF Transcript_18403/g.27375 Transcript_18403/m.27375 type:complete len:95 (-) Transcript_18403:272-556(-)
MTLVTSTTRTGTGDIVLMEDMGTANDPSNEGKFEQTLDQTLVAHEVLQEVTQREAANQGEATPSVVALKIREQKMTETVCLSRGSNEKRAVRRN